MPETIGHGSFVDSRQLEIFATSQAVVHLAGLPKLDCLDDRIGLEQAMSKPRDATGSCRT